MPSDERNLPTTEIASLLERTVRVEAPVETVWQLLSDPCRLSEWSPTVHRVDHQSGELGAEGSRYVNHNRDGELEWITHSVITRCEEPQFLAFRIEENWSVWSFQLGAEPDGTCVVQRRRTPEGISPLAQQLTETYMGGQAAFTKSLLRGMDETLARIRIAAEATTRGAKP